MFTPKISNPIKNNIPATEIQLNDRLITNNELKDFFINIPKRLDIIEAADDVSDNLDALVLTNDVNKNKEEISDLKEDVKTINDAVDELNEMMGAKYISGTVQFRLNEIWNTIFGTEGLVEYITDVNDDVVNIKNIDIVNMQSELNDHESTINDHKELIDLYGQKILNVENKTAQIDVNTANVEVIRSLVNSLQAQIEQIRAECNNTLASYNSRLLAIEEQIGLA